MSPRTSSTTEENTPDPSTRSTCAAEDAVYRVKEAAVVLKLSRAATYAALRRGQIPARRVGRRWLIPRHALHTWLNTAEQITPETTWETR